MVGTLVWGCRYALSWCDLDLAFDLALVTLIYKILLKTTISLYMVGTLDGWCKCATSWCDLEFENLVRAISQQS